MSESISHDLREAWRQLRVKNADLAATCLESAGALEKAEAEVRRLRDENMSLLGIIADIRAAVSDPSGVMMLSELIEHCRVLHADVDRLRAREATAREILQAHADEYERTDTDDGVLRAAERLDIWMSAKRWLETE